MRGMLQTYLGKPVQINFRNRLRTETARLTHLHADSFSVSAPGSDEQYHFPLRHLVSARESAGPATGKPTELLLEVHRAAPDGDRH